MSHRKVYSQGSIPFSWEDKPGISKVATQADLNPRDYRVKALDLTSSASSISIDDPSSAYSDLKLKIPLPPCPKSQPPSRSNSAKGLKWQEDPFLLAYKECTKPQKKASSASCSS
ncbi:uncharacterized protein LOC133807328 isoform X2 [Humulus lupulus]|uniref:uncharacterized protein LOC133807328 isoform X2 n=1 Tax=Humulus lupulus TaxID=3486 RepID=UPI002B40DFD9|nr:uncharacterized protein LOC133807328 isoform X2 [Humulus lupulus]